MSPALLPEHQRGGLQVRLWEPHDVTALAACIGDNLHWLGRFVPWIAEEASSAERRRDLIRRWRRQFDAGLDATYGIWLDGAVAGGCGLHRGSVPGAWRSGTGSIAAWCGGEWQQRRQPC